MIIFNVFARQVVSDGIVLIEIEIMELNAYDRSLTFVMLFD